MNLRSTRIPVLAAAAAVAITLTACGSGTEATDSSNAGGTTTKKLTISATGVDSLPFMAILQVAIDKGWFKDKGLDVSMYSGGGGGNTLRVVTSGDADMAIAGNSSVILASQQPSSNLQIIAPWFQVNDFSWIAPKGRSMTNATLGFSSAGSSTELIVKGLEKKLGVKSQAVGGMGDNWTAAKAGKITAGWAMHPFITSKEAEGAEVLVDSRDVLGDLPADLVAVNADYAKQNPQNITDFFLVAQQAMDYVVDDTDAAAKDIATIIKMDPATVAKGLRDTPDLRKAYSLKVEPAALNNLSELMVQAGQIKQNVDWAKVLDQQFLPESDRASL
ncbi:ABC transporter substrate-binding protein [Intrasporangium sp.]|uniref:ABC transporter substrate-binding protein n=1 Tax=Intrasporangium sp. TaxID=1925024 RepID=UPI003221B584